MSEAWFYKTASACPPGQTAGHRPVLRWVPVTMPNWSSPPCTWPWRPAGGDVPGVISARTSEAFNSVLKVECVRGLTPLNAFQIAFDGHLTAPTSDNSTTKISR
ncbi:hypothetical protein [Streptomyces sp. WMMC940]|uniref:hypothetical protein n=1 Tax=Streptomyces sp. WMMC940 TaxID=3015153 RepID=UPI0022B62ECD|nr:hypothetical protein [Streptomyces sp. WMMC940]MCZ7462385.1 hypothetical protein [Streptomyces sp. WMMC940]